MSELIMYVRTRKRTYVKIKKGKKDSLHVFKNYFSRTLDRKLVKEQEHPEVAKLSKWGYL